MSGKPLFLDTSIQIARRGFNKSEVEEINNFISTYEFICTSYYVKLEFKGSYLQDLAYLHNSLVNLESFSKALFKARQLMASSGHNRKLSNVLEALCVFFGNGISSIESDSDIDKELADKAALYLENIIDDSWDWENEEEVKYISDKIRCLRAKEPPKKKKKSFEVKIGKCKPEKIRCKVNCFFEDHREDFENILKLIKKTADVDKHKPAELEKIASIIEKGLSDPNIICSSDNCRGLGDAMVAVEGKHFKELFTKDIDQDKIISKAVGLKSKLLSYKTAI